MRRQWVLNAYALVFGGLLLLFGRLGDRMGRRRLFIAGLIVFLAGSVLAGVATQAWVLLGPNHPGRLASAFLYFSACACGQVGVLGARSPWTPAACTRFTP
jgi:MFS family permease